MKCIKTGCDVFLMEYGAFVHGDAHLAESGDLVIRTAGPMTHQPQGSRRHFTILSIDYWFDQPHGGGDPNGFGTLIATRGMFNDHGYEGIAEPKAAASLED